MRSKLFARAFTLAAFALPAFPADSCPVTKAPAPYRSRQPGGFFLGTESLWTFVDTYDSSQRHREGLPYAFKLLYWHPGLDWQHTDETDALTVVARRRDARSAPIVLTPHANMVRHLSAEAPDEVAMMTGLDLPSGGCWEITADFKGERLNYVISLR